MDEIKFYCLKCKQKLAVEPDEAGSQVSCPVCGAMLKVPSSSVAGGEAVTGGGAGVLVRQVLPWVAVFCSVAVLAGSVVFLFWPAVGEEVRLSSADAVVVGRDAGNSGGEPVLAVVSSAVDVVASPTIVVPESGAAVVLALPAGDGAVDLRSKRDTGLVSGLETGRVVEVEFADRELAPEERKRIFGLLMAADERAAEQARVQHPMDAMQALRAGERVVLKGAANLYAVAPENGQFASADAPIAVLGAGQSLVVREVRKGGAAVWCQVDAFDKNGKEMGDGWVPGSDLVQGSGVDPERQRRLQWKVEGELAAEYRVAVQRENKLNAGQIQRILAEGVEAGWYSQSGE